MANFRHRNGSEGVFHFVRLVLWWSCALLAGPILCRAIHYTTGRNLATAGEHDSCQACADGPNCQVILSQNILWMLHRLPHSTNSISATFSGLQTRAFGISAGGVCNCPRATEVGSTTLLSHMRSDIQTGSRASVNIADLRALSGTSPAAGKEPVIA